MTAPISPLTYSEDSVQSDRLPFTLSPVALILMPPTANPALPNALPDALLLAATGGMLDAVVYLNHGHVFASSMTGNVVFLGIAFFSQDWREIVRHLVPIGGFFAGVTASKYVRFRLAERSVLLFGLTFEAVVLFLLGWLPISYPHVVFTIIIAFVAAFQVASYRRVQSFSYNSTFVTGNLRDVAEGLYDAIAPSAIPEVREKGQAKTRALGLICLCFLAGAATGAWGAPRLGNYSLWLAEPLLITATLRALRHQP
jgi:uncharacterized membrane protein YoaK (UPF0700 family)